MLYRVFLVIISISVISFSKVVTFKELDPQKIIIQMALFKSEKNFKKVEEKFFLKDDIYFKRGKNYTLVYMVNIPVNNTKSVLKRVKKIFKDAFVLSNGYKKIKEHHQNNSFKQMRVTTDSKESLSNKADEELYESYVLTGLKFFEKENYLKAYSFFKQAYGINKRYINVNFYLGRSAYELKKYKEALKIYKNILKEDPDYLEVNLEVAKTYNKLHKYEESKKYFLKSYK